MSLPSLILNRTSGGIGRQQAGTDYYSGYIHYFPTSYTLPTGFLSQPIQILNSITDLIALGVSGNSADETKAIGTYVISTKGNTGDAIQMNIAIPVPNAPSIIVPSGLYTVGASDTTIALQGAAWAAVINANTYVHGFTASFTTATLTVTSKPGLGISLNTGTPITIALTGAFVGTITQFSGGIGSQYDVLYYHVREFFRMQGIINGQPQGQLWLACYNIVSSPSTYANFTEVATVQAFANGAIKQIGVYTNSSAFATSHTTALQAQCATLAANNQPLSIVYQGDFSGSSGLGGLQALSNLRTLTNRKVTVCLGQDGGNVGAQVYQNLGKSVGCLGTTLGSIALAAVNESLVWRGKFNVIDTLEYITLAFSNGSLHSTIGAGLNGLMTQLDAYGYLFLLHEVDLPGTYFSNSPTCVTISDNYAYVEDNRTIDKACRLVRAAILPALGSPLTFNSDGTLTADTIGYFEGLGDNALAQMLNAGEISAEETIINPAQNVQTTQTLTITIEIVQRGVARNITINIGFVAAIA